MATFPTYARFISAGFTQKRDSAVQRTAMESGPPKQLKIKSRVMVTRQMVYRLPTANDYSNFVAFFQTTINYGADWFTWTDPVDGVAKLARIVSALDSEAPLVRKVHWLVKFQLETWSG